MPTIETGMSRAALVWLLATAAVSVAPHATHLPIWLMGGCTGLLLWFAWSTRKPLRPARWGMRLLLVLIALAAALSVRQHFGHFFGKDPGVALLAVLLCLKLLESATPRDVRAAVLLSFFLQLGLFFYNQTLPIAALALIGTLCATGTLLSLQDPSAGAAHTLRRGALLMVQAIPLLLVLFVLFPRVPGPLWGLPADAYSGTSGLSETMAPGSISALTLSEAIAFRADFDGPAPPPAQRYWRGPVLTHFDGRAWRPADATSGDGPSYEVRGQGYAYRLTLEAHNQRWLLALEHPASGLAEARYASDYRLLAQSPVRARTRYDLRAYPHTPVGLSESDAVLDAASVLPEGANPRARALARELADGARDPDDTLARILAHLRALDLVYTLRPPALGTHSVDEFLFDTRRGFCEHFASAFVFLMRAAGVPARVVTGYQGGTLNPVDGTLVVRQSDAHAWAEIWVRERGWLRVDPTALAAPARIESGLAAALPEGEQRGFLMRPEMRWAQAFRHRWEALSNAWNQVVLGYDNSRQTRLLERFGFARPDWRTLSALLAGATAVVMMALFGWAMLQRRHTTPLERAWGRFCAKLSRRGLTRLRWEGPIDYAERVARSRPDLLPATREIATRYARICYGPQGTHTARETRHLIRQINEFKPK